MDYFINNIKYQRIYHFILGLEYFFLLYPQISFENLRIIGYFLRGIFGVSYESFQESFDDLSKGRNKL